MFFTSFVLKLMILLIGGRHRLVSIYTEYEIYMTDRSEFVAGKFENTSKKKRPLWPWVLGLFLVAGLLLGAWLFLRETELGQPTLTVESPGRLSLSETEDFTVDVEISNLGEALYPAMSMSLRFDPGRLEFLGVEEGNVFIYDNNGSTGQSLPEWSYNTETANGSGLINLMYLDVTGGKYAFGQELLEEEGNVLLRLSFRLRGSVRQGDVLDLVVEDAVFASSQEEHSLAMTTDTLKVKHGKFVIGE